MMNSESLGSVVALLPFVVFLIIYVMALRRSKQNMAEVTRINEALLSANLEMVKKLQNIEAMLQKDRQD
ncbi:hypothetical protein P6U16_13745 [Rhizobium sp. 32-5/1]|uniref:hypothetical protein n=1 Tax=Rhizobium sp. 32-5/1 TaxID=3019602 RepID=UPI00240D5C12|nr:hypothetical protein [Rhizobium sp. 32-5/1]WEZ82231.1 hypothetical protein P6U16_13745 [Rhizobium sp. 32-5/1]